MITSIKRKLYIVAFVLLVLVGCVAPINNYVDAKPPKFQKDFVDPLTGKSGGEERIITVPCISKDNTVRENVVCLFYPNRNGGGNVMYNVIRDMTLGIMIAFIVRAGASLLFDRKPENLKKTLWNLVYILLGGCFVYGANRLFGSVLSFNGSEEFTASTESGVNPIVNSFTGGGGVMFIVLSALKTFAFFSAIIMTVITGIRVIYAGDGEKGKKLVKGLINIVVALLIIKGIDFIFYITEDSQNALQNLSRLVINVAKVFAYIYGILIVIMVIIAGYLYITDGGNGSNFKKASNVLVNILLSGLVLFAFLLILYQIFKEFSTGGDAVSMLIRNFV